MYKSPIELVVNNDFNTLKTELENGIVKAVQSYSVYCDKEELIKALAYDRDQYQKGFADGRATVEPLTDAEQRIFLKAINREEEICKLIDEEYKDEEYTLNLVNVCNEIIRKVKGALWT